MGKRRVARVCGRIGQDLSMSIETCQDFSHVFRLLGVWQWRIQGRGPKGSKKKSCSSISAKYIDFLEPIVISCDFFNWLLETHVSSNHRNV